MINVDKTSLAFGAVGLVIGVGISYCVVKSDRTAQIRNIARRDAALDMLKHLNSGHFEGERK